MTTINQNVPKNEHIPFCTHSKVQNMSFEANLAVGLKQNPKQMTEKSECFAL